jgi:hypothetical protein
MESVKGNADDGTMSGFWRLAVLTAGLLSSQPTTVASARQGPENNAIPAIDCRHEITKAERRYRIPAQLLSAISLAEAGRWLAPRRAFVAWPWTVYAERRGRHFANKAAALAAVKRLRAKGVRNIDVGCMQVNLHYHPRAFRDLGQALEPVSNIDYAARLLRRLHGQYRSWSAAVAHYHSATETLGRPYRIKVMRLWHQERRRAMTERQRLAQAEFQRRRAAWRARRQPSQKNAIR